MGARMSTLVLCFICTSFDWEFLRKGERERERETKRDIDASLSFIACVDRLGG